jgi:hypothetical protein
MATRRNVNAGSVFCRDCGGPTVTAGGVSACPNTTTQGTQQVAQDVCENLAWQRRRFCEHCGLLAGNGAQCTNPPCGLPPLRP